MKLQNHKVARTLAAAAVATCAVAMLSVGAFAADVAIGEKDPTYGGYGAPAGPAIQGNIMLISADGDVAVGEKDPTYGGYGARKALPSRATSCSLVPTVLRATP